MHEFTGGEGGESGRLVVVVGRRAVRDEAGEGRLLGKVGRGLGGCHTSLAPSPPHPSQTCACALPLWLPSRAATVSSLSLRDGDWRGEPRASEVRGSSGHSRTHPSSLPPSLPPGRFESKFEVALPCSPKASGRSVPSGWQPTSPRRALVLKNRRAHDRSSRQESVLWATSPHTPFPPRHGGCPGARPVCHPLAGLLRERLHCLMSARVP